MIRILSNLITNDIKLLRLLDIESYYYFDNRAF